MDEVIEIVNTTLPLKHQVGKLVLGTLAGFAAGKLTEKAYDVVLDCIKNKKIVNK